MPAGANPNSVVRPVADFKPNPWGDQFLHYIPDIKTMEAQHELARELKVELKKEMLSIEHKPLLEQLRLIDSIERLGVAYHFEEEIGHALQHIHDMNASSDDVCLISLRFRLLRQHGFNVSCDVLKGFISLTESLNEKPDCYVQGLLSLYEACHVRIHGEEIMDEALAFTTSTLKNLLQHDELSHTLKEGVSHALQKAPHKRLTRLESLNRMQVYEQDPLHHKTLLRLAKLDFNLLQSLHKSELSDLSRWWKQIDVTTRLPLRERMVECYFWSTGVHHEPQYSIGRKIFTLSAQIMTLIDDLYDSFGTLQELHIFTQALQRWDKSGLDQLPEDYRWFYQTLILDAFEAMECDLAAQGRSVYVNYAREEMKALSQTYLIEASWRHKKYIPTFDEYMEIAVRNSGFVAQILFTFLDMDIANYEAFSWLRSLPKPVKAVGLLLRIHNDIASTEIDKTRGHSPLMIVSYMRQYDVSYEQACEELLEKSRELWKDLSEAMVQPIEVPMPLLKCMLDLARLIDYTYDGGVDAYTTVNKGMMKDITSLFINFIPI